MSHRYNAPHIFGIRHHGPGSSRSLLDALTALQPDALLVEGPPDAAEVLPLIAHAEMQPPVALLIYAPEMPHKAVYYPFTAFSPEWNAIRYGLSHNIPVRFIDLAQTHQLAFEKLETSEILEAVLPIATPDPIRSDPLGALAQAAGYADGERWWEHLVEQRRASHAPNDAFDIFAAILEAMSALRETLAQPLEPREALREATMRQAIRAAQKEGFTRIAVVCGAWHAPVLATMPTATDDQALLKGLPKIKVAATWIPWTHGRLTLWSGYGAGIRSPGWYQHLWEHPDRVAISWLAKTAQLLREQDFDASPAQIIDAVRLADTLAIMRERAIPGLDELLEVTRTVFCFGSDKPMALIDQKLIIGEVLGSVPDDAPMIPLQQDLRREQRRLLMRPTAEASVLNLDLRTPMHLERSHLLHRLRLLEVGWGKKESVASKGGTFHEVWQLHWLPELTIALIEKSAWGNTLLDAAAAYACHAAEQAADLPALTALMREALLADLPGAISELVRRLQAVSALTEDVRQLMASVPPLAEVFSYSDVRGTDAAMIGPLIDGIVTRVWVGLPGACVMLSDDAAQPVLQAIIAFDGALHLLQNAAYFDTWYNVLQKLLDSDSTHGLLSGRSCRILFDSTRLTADESARVMRRETSVGKEPLQTAAWLEGFLGGSGTILTHDVALLRIVDAWIAALNSDTFTVLLPLLRRTFATFSDPERHQIGELVRGKTIRTHAKRAGNDADTDPIDAVRTTAILQTIAQLLGLDYQESPTL